MISLVRASQVLEYVSDVFKTFNYNLSNTVKRNLLNDLRQQQKRALGKGLSWSHTWNLTVMGDVPDICFFLQYLVRVTNNQNQ